MTIEQQEQHILQLIGRLPILRRIRLALTVLRGVDPQQIDVSQASPGESWETPEFFQELDSRYDAMVNGQDQGVTPDQLFQQIESKLS